MECWGKCFLFAFLVGTMFQIVCGMFGENKVNCENVSGRTKAKSKKNVFQFCLQACKPRTFWHQHSVGVGKQQILRK